MRAEKTDDPNNNHWTIYDGQNAVLLAAYLPAMLTTAAEVLAYYPALQSEIDNPPAPEAALALRQVACARLWVDGWDITGIERSIGLSMAFMLDEQTAWVFFSEPQPDSNYIVLPGEGVTKYPDYIEVVRAGMADLSMIIQRVQ